MAQHDPARDRVDRLSVGLHLAPNAVVVPAFPREDDADLNASVEVAADLPGSTSAVEAPDVVSASIGAIFTVPAGSFPAVAGRMLKRALDVAVGVLGLTIMLALFPIAFLLVSLDSPGPVVYGQRRVGRDTRRGPADSATRRRAIDYGGRPFTVFKLRTMRCDAESRGPRLAAEDDPRITRIGRFLRRYHIDEWPQFMSILSGNMSLVGPRPERPFFAVRYRREIPRYRCRTAGIRPGLIGLSQVLVGYDHSMVSVRAKADLDARYRNFLVGEDCTWFAIDSRVVLETAKYMCGRRPLGDVDSVAVPALIEQYEERAG